MKEKKSPPSNRISFVFILLLVLVSSCEVNTNFYRYCQDSTTQKKTTQKKDQAGSTDSNKKSE